MKYTLIAALLACTGSIFAQKAWLEPGGSDFNPEDSVSIYVNVSETDRKQLQDIKEDVYLWTWSPAENKGPYKLGSWNSTNDVMRMRRSKTNPNIYFYRMIATEFYAVSASEVYDKGFSFLVKAKDGADKGKGEMKTEDLSIKPEKPGLPKVYTMPAIPKSLKKKSDTAPDTLPVSQDDFITIYYNNKLEVVPEMQALTEKDEIHAFIRITGSNGTRYLNALQTELGRDVRSKLKYIDDGIFAVTYNVGDLWRTSREPRNPVSPPATATPTIIEVQFARVSPDKPNINTEPKADGIFTYFIGKCR
jgi:hypothetical protein